MKFIFDHDVNVNLLQIYSHGSNGAGGIPREIENLTMLKEIHLDSNNFNEIPNEIFSLDQAEMLYVGFNALKGHVHVAVFNMTSLTTLVFNLTSLTNSIMSGNIPIGIGNLSSLVSIYLGYNELNFVKAKYIILGIISVVLLVASVSIFLHLKRNVEVPIEATSLSQHLLWRRVSQLELVRVTNGFNENNLLGSGGFGSVYKGALSDGTYVAVKVFSLKLEGAFKSFDRECEMLSNIRHRNLIKIISCCSEIDFKALVLNYMPNGSLEKWLYSENSSLDFLERMNITIDAASALEYLHHGYSLPILHCDIKPNNILLDDDMVAHVADFGIAKLLGGGDFTTESMTLATVGYMAPEYGMEGIFSTRGMQWIANSLLPDAIIAEVMDANLLGTKQKDNDFVRKRDCLSSIMR
ncbi:hypothetical protein PRUPE_4G063200 [Prunus persica]|uniref:Protein kinase domain-containing protein n=1 Tax=Prunus persica TaxID=3760 RepID=A0A251PGL1_PRUPE|nr:hypothetical protein PRUPE_4G063200 [Prunus persica]